MSANPEPIERGRQWTAEYLRKICERDGHYVNVHGCVDADVAAALLDTTPGVLKTWRWRQCGPHWTRASRVMYALADLSNWLNERSSRDW